MRLQLTRSPLKLALRIVGVAVATANGLSFGLLIAKEVATAFQTAFGLIVLASRTKLAGFIAATFSHPTEREID